MRPLQFFLTCKGYNVRAALYSDDEGNLSSLVDFQGSPIGIDYESLDAWAADCEKIFYEYEDDPDNQQGCIQRYLMDEVLALIKQALSTNCE